MNLGVKNISLIHSTFENQMQSNGCEIILGAIMQNEYKLWIQLNSENTPKMNHFE